LGKGAVEGKSKDQGGQGESGEQPSGSRYKQVVALGASVRVPVTPRMVELSEAGTGSRRGGKAICRGNAIRGYTLRESEVPDSVKPRTPENRRGEKPERKPGDDELLTFRTFVATPHGENGSEQEEAALNSVRSWMRSRASGGREAQIDSVLLVGFDRAPRLSGRFARGGAPANFLQVLFAVPSG